MPPRTCFGNSNWPHEGLLDARRPGPAAGDPDQTYLKAHAPDVAASVTLQLARRALELGELPAMGKRLERYRPADVRELLERPYRLIYRVTQTQVEILTVLHYRQLMPADLADLHD